MKGKGKNKERDWEKDFMKGGRVSFQNDNWLIKKPTLLNKLTYEWN